MKNGRNGFPRSKGVVIHTPEQRKLHVEVDPAIVDYARSLIPAAQRVGLNRQRYTPHITLIRNEEPTRDLSRWDGHVINFTYDPRVVVGEIYWWLRVWSPMLLVIRHSSGLPPLFELCRPPDGEDCFHITIGNTKGR